MLLGVGERRLKGELQLIPPIHWSQTGNQLLRKVKVEAQGIRADINIRPHLTLYCLVEDAKRIEILLFKL